MFSGSLVAIVTPFRNGKVDEGAFGDLIEWQIANGTNGIVPCGTTGESATLTHDEHRPRHRVSASKSSRAGCRSLPGRVPTAPTKRSRSLDTPKRPVQMGRCSSRPYYNKPTQEGLYRHYKAVAEAVDLPLVLYNIPGRTGVEHVAGDGRASCGDENIVAIKEGSGSVQQASDIAQACGDRLTVLAGDDALTLPMMAVGAKGVITVTANIVPKEMSPVGRLVPGGPHRRSAPYPFPALAAVCRTVLMKRILFP